MKRYLFALSVLFLQFAMFYLFPLTCGPTDAMGMVFLILFSVLVLGLIMGLFCEKKLKYLWPVAVSLVFLPSVPIYYNSSALVHALWYLITAAVGLSIGSLLRMVLRHFFTGRSAASEKRRTH